MECDGFFAILKNNRKWYELHLLHEKQNIRSFFSIKNKGKPLLETYLQINSPGDRKTPRVWSFILNSAVFESWAYLTLHGKGICRVGTHLCTPTTVLCLIHTPLWKEITGLSTNAQRAPTRGWGVGWGSLREVSFHKVKLRIKIKW